MLARVLASYAAWLTVTFAHIPVLVAFFICITVPIFVGSVIWHLWKTHPRSVVNQIAFCGAVAFFSFLAIQLFVMSRL